MKLIHISDIHINPEPVLDGDPISNFYHCMAHVEEHHSDADMVVITGDLTHHGQRSSYNHLKSMLAEWPFNPFVIIGNHDHRQTFQELFSETPKDENGFVQYSVQRDEGLFVFLDTVEFGTHAGHFCNERQNWLRNQLESAASAQQAVYLFMHHNPIEVGVKSSDSIGLVDGPAFREILSKYRNTIRHLFFGHCHYILSGSVCSIPMSAPRSTNHPCVPDFSGTENLGFAPFPPTYNVCLISEEGVVVHSIDFRMTIKSPGLKPRQMAGSKSRSRKKHKEARYMAKVSIKNIDKSFGQTRVLKDVSLEIDDGEFVSLVGPSGCGKSTLLRIISGLEGQDAGDIFIGPENVNAKRAADRNLSMVFQSYALYPHLSVAENIAVPLKMRKMSSLQRLPLLGPFLPGSRTKSREVGIAVEKAASTLQINHLLDRKPGQLSGGQRQRVAVGRALVRDPAAFLLDEPLSNLDAKLRVHTRAEIAQLHRQLDATFIYVTHDQVEAMTMSDRIAVMMDGEILQVGAPAAIYDFPCDIRVAEFMGLPKMAIFPAKADADGNLVILGKDTGQKMAVTSCFLSVGVRPEHLILSSANSIISGRLEHLENLGSEAYAHVGVEGMTEPVVVKTTRSDIADMSVGSTVALSYRPEHLHIFDHDGIRLNDAIHTASGTASSRRLANV